MCIHAENIGLKIETCVSFQVLFDIANYLGVKGESFENFKTSLDACFPHCKVRIYSSLREISFKNYFFLIHLPLFENENSFKLRGCFRNSKMRTIIVFGG